MVLQNSNYKHLLRWRNLKAAFLRHTWSQKYDMRIIEHHFKEKDAATLWKFRGEEDIDRFYTLDDNMTGGRSLVELSTSKGGRLHMKGKIDPTPSYYNENARPWDGTGYAGIRSYPFWNTWGDFELSEKTNDLHRWQQFEFRVRGDGRCYRIQLWFKSRLGDPAQEGTKFWVAHMQTRGGPYWERIKIPFNRFYPIKHEQITAILHKPPMMKLYSLGIYPDNQLPGDFSLEIDSIRALNSFVDEDNLYTPENVWKFVGNSSVTQDQEILGKYRKSRVYSKHDHILLE